MPGGLRSDTVVLGSSHIDDAGDDDDDDFGGDFDEASDGGRAESPDICESPPPASQTAGSTAAEARAPTPAPTPAPAPAPATTDPHPVQTRASESAQPNADPTPVPAAAAASSTPPAELESAPAPASVGSRPDVGQPDPPAQQSEAHVPSTNPAEDAKPKPKSRARKSGERTRKPKPKPVPFDPRYVSHLAKTPDPYWTQLPIHNDPNSMIAYIDSRNPLELLTESSIRDRSPITGMTLSPDGTMLVTFSNSGNISFWDLETLSLVQTLRDNKEPDIDEFYVGRFTPDSMHLIVGGKLKDRRRWSEQDDDNHIMPCPLKIFDVVSGEVVRKFEGHEEEVLCIKSAVFKGQNYFISTSQDGYIIRWHMASNWIDLVDQIWMQDGITCMAFTVSFLPHTGNKYFVAACDDNIRLYDFENAQLQQTFANIYSYYCDCIKAVHCLDFDESPAWDDATKHPESPMFAYMLSRGVEMPDAENNTINSIPNTVRLHRLVYPTEYNGQFVLEEVERYRHDLYRSNSWLVKVASNGRYVAAPTYDGNVCLFHLQTGQLVGILQDHEGIEVRDVIFHPSQKLMMTCADDGTVKVYTQRTPSSAE
nr:hypothetical protein HK105_007587 [Polyrhizophydium stewartii]